MKEMAYQRFRIPESSLPPATLATDATLAVEEAQTVADVASVARQDTETDFSHPPSPALPDARPDAEAYVEALRQIGPCGYGAVAAFLGWGATRAGRAETELRLAGRIVYDATGRGKLREQSS